MRSLLNTLKSNLRYDEESGDFLWIVKRGRAKAGSIAGRVNPNGYRYIGVNGKEYLAARLVWLWHHGSFPPNCIDHINGVKLDNRIQNLRPATVAQNAENLRKGKSNHLLGAHPQVNCSTWYSKIVVKGKRVHLGAFATEIEAHTAYVEAKRKLHEFNTL